MPQQSRRSLMKSAIFAAAAPLLAASAEAPASPAASPLDAARQTLLENAKAVAAVPLAQSVEPALLFKV